MIENFEELNLQLAELAAILNSFQSEAVQLRIVELIFERTTETSTETSNPKPKKRKVRKSAEDSEPRQVQKRPGTATAGQIIDDLISEGYFKSHRMIKDIITHCKNDKARTFKTNEMSTPLTRAVRSKKLKRETNAEGQYEYFE